jgi:hypothetical protein
MTVRELRESLVTAIESVVSDRVTVYPTSIDGVAGLPAVVLGMPTWRPLGGCLSSWEFPVAVIVARPGSADAATVSELDDLWPEVLDGLLALRGRGLDDVLRAEFGLFDVRGQAYPAQVLTCALTTSS